MLALLLLVLLQARYPISTPLPVLRHFNDKFDSVTAVFKKSRQDSVAKAKWYNTMKRYSKELSWPFKIIK